jgi:hypothetical protein
MFCSPPAVDLIGEVSLFLLLSKLTVPLSISVSSSEVILTGPLIPSLYQSKRSTFSIVIQGTLIPILICSSVSFH